MKLRTSKWNKNEKDGEEKSVGEDAILQREW